MEMQTFWGAVTAIAAVTTSLVAVITLLALKRDSMDRTRPYLVATLNKAVLTENGELRIENVGQSSAKNVRVWFSPALPTLSDAEEADKVAPFLRKRYEVQIATWAPGVSFTNLYQSAREDYEPVPSDVRVVIRYQDQHRRFFLDYYDLSMDHLRFDTGAYPSNSDERGMRRREVKALEAVARGIGRA
ncbi:hypothetical protein [Williamsia muralis]|uniref:hypothetical protein n=1 Tax=Williamsia marianensis TaxID=85044 RepID=UPI000DE739FB|nr:hypothetical protein [Williamsia marianensis]PVY34221.1 hypothetical protein C7458_101630 [Williamsia marianensis]